MATTREKYQRTHPSDARCQRCKRKPRVIRSKQGNITAPLILCSSPSGKWHGMVCQVCFHVLKAYGYTLFGPSN